MLIKKGRVRGINSTFWAICSPANRRKFSDNVKIPLRKAIVHFANMYPKPSRDNLYNDNAVLMLELKEWFESHDTNEIRTQMFLAAFDIAIVEYDHDIYYRRRADALIKKIVELVNDGRWKFDNGEPGAWPYAHCWNEPVVNDIYQERLNARLEQLKQLKEGKVLVTKIN